MISINLIRVSVGRHEIFRTFTSNGKIDAALNYVQINIYICIGDLNGNIIERPSSL